MTGVAATLHMSPLMLNECVANYNVHAQCWEYGMAGGGSLRRKGEKGAYRRPRGVRRSMRRGKKLRDQGLDRRLYGAERR
jgi:hypothetical protein